MARRDDIDLMLHHDGELAPADEQAVAADLAMDEQARAKVAAIEQIGNMVRGHLELEADSAEPKLDRLWTAVEAAVSQGATKAPAAARAADAARQPGLWDGVRTWMDRWRSNLLTGAVCAAAAAVIVMVTQRAPEPIATVARRADALPAAGTPVSPPPAAQRLVAQPPVVESLDVRGGAGAVLTIPAETEDENPTTVIWITAEDIMEDPI